jgi:hypothetical protein
MPRKSNPETTPDHDPEAAVRRYLMAVADPTTLIDVEEVDRLDALLAEADDPVDKLRILSARDRASTVNMAEAEEGFVATASAWATANEVSSDAFAQLGVPQQVLVQAGLASARNPRPAGRPASSARKPNRAGARVSSSTVAATIPHGPFTASDLASASGATVPTVRKVLAEQVASGAVAVVDPPPLWRGKGRAPTFYSRT